MKTALPIPGTALASAALPLDHAVFKDKVGWLQAWEQALWQQRQRESVGRGVAGAGESTTQDPGRRPEPGQAHSAGTRDVESTGREAASVKTTRADAGAGPMGAAPFVTDGGGESSASIGVVATVGLQTGRSGSMGTVLPSAMSEAPLPPAVAVDMEYLRVIDGESGLKVFIGGTGWSGAELLRAIRPRLASLGLRLAKLTVNGRVLWDAERALEPPAMPDDDSTINQRI